MKAAHRYRQKHAPHSPVRNDIRPLSAEAFLGDGAFSEVTIGDRSKISVRVWGKGTELFLDHGAIDTEKLHIDGAREQEALLLGFRANVMGDSISLPDPKIIGSRNLGRTPALNQGNHTLDVHTVKELR